ncbi:hypothetical protein ACIGNX_07175 [Actinosynnema sp. NPDC053489]|uniref:hypothetical protein n=1 Tax=Actinosynnema sp. NPDC053489 TaxID=3363916 RepID=UPI0037C6DC83
MIKGLSARVVLSLAVLGAIATGCTTGGTATPGTTTVPTTGQPSRTTTSKPAGGGDPLADFDPCPVLESVSSQLNLSEIEKVDEKECGAEYSPTVSFGLTKQPELAIGDAVGNGKKSDISIGSRKAKRVEAPATKTSCLVAVEVGPTSRVDVIASSDNSLDAACEAATKVATAIEPKLPK